MSLRAWATPRLFTVYEAMTDSYPSLRTGSHDAIERDRVWESLEPRVLDTVKPERSVAGRLVATLAREPRESSEIDEDDRRRTRRLGDRREAARGEVPLEALDDPTDAALLQISRAEPQEHVRRQPRDLGERDTHVIGEFLQ